MDLSPSKDYEFDVAAVTMYPIRNPGGGIEEYDAAGLTINGPYRGGGGGDLILGESDGGEPFIPTDTAELSNGDIMILFAKEDEDMMRIGYVTRDELRQAIFGKGTLRPEFIAELARRDGDMAKRDARHTIGEQTGLAIREDRTSGRIFLYMVNDNYWGDLGYNLLSTFEWIPAGRESPGWCQIDGVRYQLERSRR
ncbi:hypothetical protein FOZ62_025829 [Perkinsus olseni]|uniref:Uncharacterized protein n=1 Tax=Perkinsus olseni TaxID=32597 RepID=A0A7J6U7S2_PEROL|nr:hypothetical protein FOZ62_025829 [Perkinsus olseni]